MHDSSVPVMESPPPEYPGPTNYMQSSQPGYVKKGQPVHQGYVIQPPPSYGVQYNPVGTLFLYDLIESANTFFCK